MHVEAASLFCLKHLFLTIEKHLMWYEKNERQYKEDYDEQCKNARKCKNIAKRTAAD
jgi:hypothetical protein